MKIFQRMKALFFCLLPSILCGQEGDSFPLSIISPPTNHPLRACNTALKEIVVTSPRGNFKCIWFPYFKDYTLTNGLDFEIKSTEFSSMTVEEAEKLYAELAEYYLKRINQIKIIRPFLKEFPLDVSKLYMCIGFNDKNDQSLPPPNITGMILGGNGQFEYLQYNKNIYFISPYVPIIKKNLSEVPILNHLRSISVPRTKEQVKPIVPTVRLKDFAPQGLVAHNCGLKVAKKYKVKLLLDGPEEGRDKGDRRYSLGFTLWGSQKIVLDDARVMAVAMAKDVLDDFRKSEAIKGYLEECNQYFGEHNGPIMEPHHFSFRISFWDEDINRYEAPYIAEVRYLKGAFKYFTADDGQRLVPVLEESFDEGMRFLEGRK